MDDHRSSGRHLSLLLVDSELELVPMEHWSHPSVTSNARKRGKKASKVLLDSSLHYSIFTDPSERERRGRPDIIHQFLLVGLDSLLNIEGRLNIYVHTRNDELIVVSPTVRLPKNYNRWAGLIEELLDSGAVPNRKEPLLEVLPGMDLRKTMSFITEKHGGTKPYTIAFEQEGRKVDTIPLFSGLDRELGIEKAVLCLMGGFSHGDFRSKVVEVSDDVIGLPGGALKVWTVEAEVLVGFRQGTFRGNRTSGGA